MITGTLPGSQEMIRLLSKLKADTPEYPADLLATRKAAFLEQVAALNIQLR